MQVQEKQKALSIFGHTFYHIKIENQCFDWAIARNAKLFMHHSILFADRRGKGFFQNSVNTIRCYDRSMVTQSAV